MSLSGSTGSAAGSGPVPLLADRALDVVGLDDLDAVALHQLGRWGSIGTRRVTWPASGSSTRRIPSS